MLSPVNPLAVDSAFVPPLNNALKSSLKSPPLPETPALKAAAVAVDTAVNVPLLVTVSSPEVSVTVVERVRPLRSKLVVVVWAPLTETVFR